jgi:hypothetical protein
VLNGVPADGQSTAHRLVLNGPFHGVRGVVADMKDPGESGDETWKLVAPVGHGLQIAPWPEVRSDLHFEIDEPAARQVGKRNGSGDQFPVRVELLADLRDRSHHPTVFVADGVGDRRRVGWRPPPSIAAERRESGPEDQGCETGVSTRALR